MSDLEANFNILLFERLGNKIIPTPEGKIIFDEFEKIHAGLDRLLDVAGRAKRARRHVVKIGALPVYVDTLVPLLVASFFAREPSVYCLIDSLSTTAMTQSLLTEEVDIGFAALPYGISALEELPLLREHAVLALPEDHPLTAQDSVALDQLSDAVFIGLSASSPLRQAMDKFCEANNFTANYAMEARTQLTLLQLVSAGMGVAVLAASIKQHAQLSSAVFRPLQETFEWDSGLIFKKSRGREPFIKNFIECAREFDWQTRPAD